MSALKPGLYSDGEGHHGILDADGDFSYLNSDGYHSTWRTNELKPLIVLDFKDPIRTVSALRTSTTMRFGDTDLLAALAVAIEAQTKPTEWSTVQHSAEQCKFEQCAYCGCCAHGKTLIAGCKVEAAPSGMCCPTWGCGCEGKS